MEKLKLDADKRVAEKDDELDAQKLQHRRQLETLQSSCDDLDSRGKAEMSGVRKKLSGDLEEALQQIEVTKKIKADQEFSMKKLQLANKELVDQLGEEQAQNEMIREQLASMDKRGNVN